MGATSRNKGSSAEREVADKLFSELGIRFQRNLEQVRDSGHGDLVADTDDFPFTIEVKRRKVAHQPQPGWEAQVFEAARKSRLHPALIYRGDRMPWRVRIYADAVAEAFGSTGVSTRWFETDLQGFAWVAREIMAWGASK